MLRQQKEIKYKLAKLMKKVKNNSSKKGKEEPGHGYILIQGQYE